MKPLAAIKAKTWGAMQGAFKEIKSSLDPMQSFQKILEVLSIIMLPLTFIMTLFAQIIATTLMPYIKEAITKIGEWADSIDMNSNSISRAIDKLDALDTALTAAVENAIMIIVEYWHGVGHAIIDDIETTIEDIKKLFRDLRDWISGLGNGGYGGGGGGTEPGLPGWPSLPGWEMPGGPIIASASGSSNTINIDLRGSVIDDRDKLIKDITERVIIHLG